VIEFFLRRPVFATVCSLVILLLGVVAIPNLPIAQFPNIAPPTVTVTAEYTGASAEAVEASVTTPLETAINGVQGLRYMSSQSTNQGGSTITATFTLDTDLNQAANDVQNAVNLAQGDLPAEVKQTGVAVSKNNGSFVMGIGFTSTNPATTKEQITDYIENNVTNDLQRIPGVSGVQVFGERKYAMRLWVDPKRLADNGLTAADVVTQLTNQNIQVAAGAIGAPPTNGNQPYEYTVASNGRLHDPAGFGDIILRTTPDGGYVKVRDVGRVELGAQDYSGSIWYNGTDAVGVGILQLPTGNALQVSDQVQATLKRLSAKFPAGMRYAVAFDTTLYVSESIKEVVTTLLIAIALVVLVIFLFLQDWRTTLIPSLTIPISLLGTFFLMKVLGFSINTLTLFGLTLATGLVVDDAIVVIENIARFIQEKGMAPFEGAREAMAEISGAVLASSLVLLAVFVPVAFFPGTTGQLYKQFALTIACAITISLFNALTLTPVLSSIFLGNIKGENKSPFFKPVNRAINATRRTYHSWLPNVLRRPAITFACFAVLLGITGLLFVKMPTGFIPDEDQGYFIVSAQGPEGTSIDNSHRIQRMLESILARQPEVLNIFDIAGYSFTGTGSNKILMFVLLKPWEQRQGSQHTLDAILARLGGQLYLNPMGIQAFAVNPPAIPGLGFQGGFDFELEDRGNNGIAPLLGAADQVIGQAYQPNSGLAGVYTLFTNNSPVINVNVDRNKVQALGANLADVYNTMQVYLGSVYVNDFDFGGHSYRVYVQADQPYRSRLSDLQNIYVSGSTTVNGVTTPGAPIPLSGVVDVQKILGAPTITHYNQYRSITISGSAAPGYGSGQALDSMQRFAAHLPPGFAYEWSGISLEQIEGGSAAALIFALGIVFVFLVLSAQYESFADPLIILLAVPLALLGALIGLKLRGTFDADSGVSDVFAQVGYVMLIGLASKNAILIVEFANQLRAAGVPIREAAQRAAETRLRPILMTSIAFIFGVTPLVFATGAGSASRHSLGTVVFGGMICSSILNLFITPTLYVIIASIEEKFRPTRHGPASTDSEGSITPGTPTAPVSI
jgi:HAE1 family hydrophobic/amphiphilic exporter-1